MLYLETLYQRYSEALTHIFTAKTTLASKIIIISCTTPFVSYFSFDAFFWHFLTAMQTQQKIFSSELCRTTRLGQLLVFLLQWISSELRWRLSPRRVLVECDLVFFALWTPHTVMWQRNRGVGAVILHGPSKDTEQIVSALGDHR